MTPPHDDLRDDYVLYPWARRLLILLVLVGIGLSANCAYLVFRHQAACERLATSAPDLKECARWD